jgi:ABC-2 type transport system ATP-binding protein
VALRALPGVHACLFASERCVVTVDPLHVALPALIDTLRAKAIDLASLSTHRATLEDVFVTLTGRALRE